MTLGLRAAAVGGYSPALRFVLMVGIMSFFADLATKPANPDRDPR